MARIKLDLPEKFSFATEIPVRITDINYGGHLGNDSVLAVIHEARVRFLNKYGYTELNICGAGLIQSDAVIVFKAEAFYGDVIRVGVAVGDFSSTGCDFFFLLTNKADGKVIARAKTGIVFYDYTRKKPLRVPEEFLKLNG
ncbi:MAG: thioesterase [Candidatus Omnitrophica bacterium CG1_02_46_14]|nr:MAG: thioesterase [Candidatus Omnitrophica bacterium CG1_02_46_14]